MQDDLSPESLVARCIVCRGDIYRHDRYERWEGGYYCERHSLPLLRERARLYARLLQEQASPKAP